MAEGGRRDLDAARTLVVERGLTTDAIAALTPVVRELPFEALTPAKQLLKRFFSAQPWTDADDNALADVFAGAPEGRHELRPGLILEWGDTGDGFRLRVTDEERATPHDADGDAAGAPTDVAIEETFDHAVVPEPTPSPRTIRFATPPLHGGPSRTYRSQDAPFDDVRIAHLFGQFPDVTDVLVGPDFVAVTLSRPAAWEHALAPLLRLIDRDFGGAHDDLRDADDAEAFVPRAQPGRSPRAGDERSPRRLERAWQRLGTLRGDRPEDLQRILEAAEDPEPAHRQVAAALLTDAPLRDALRAWGRLVDDASRTVRRSAIDAIAGANREEVRPLLEHALDDHDAWARWKALHGLAELGAEPSRAIIEARATDPDFRVRLEANRALLQTT